MIGTVIYRVRSFAYLASNKVLEGNIRFEALPNPATVVMRGIVGYLKIGLVLGVAAMVLAFFGAVVAGALTSEDAGEGFRILLSLLMILGFLVIWRALSFIWVTQPILEHIVQSVTIRNAEALDEIRQRAADSGADAEGFADALDVGGGI